MGDGEKNQKIFASNLKNLYKKILSKKNGKGESNEIESNYCCQYFIVVFFHF